MQLAGGFTRQQGGNEDHTGIKQREEPPADDSH